MCSLLLAKGFQDTVPYLGCHEGARIMTSRNRTNDRPATLGNPHLLPKGLVTASAKDIIYTSLSQMLAVRMSFH